MGVREGTGQGQREAINKRMVKRVGTS